MADSCHSTRRAFLKSAPLAAATISLPIAGYADAAMAELPVQRVNRIAEELSHALNDYARGKMHAVVYPSNKGGQYSVGFVVTDLHITPEVELRTSMERTKQALAKMYPDKDIRSHLVHHEESGNATIIVMTE